MDLGVCFQLENACFSVGANAVLPVVQATNHCAIQ